MLEMGNFVGLALKKPSMPRRNITADIYHQSKKLLSLLWSVSALKHFTLSSL